MRCAPAGPLAFEETIAKSLKGHWLEEHIFELTQALELYRVYQSRIAECDREIETQLERFEDVTDGGSPAGNGRRRSQGNAPSFDIRTHLYRMTAEERKERRGGSVPGFQLCHGSPRSYPSPLSIQ